MYKLVALAVLAFSITLALLIGQRLSDQALAVIVGAVIGVTASVPMTALVLWLSLRPREITRQSTSYARSEYAPREEAPRMIVIQPQPYVAAPYPQTHQAAYLNPPGPMATYTRPTREFKIVGQEECENEDRDVVV